MIPRITFKEKSGRLLLKIAVHGKGHGIYETGITIDPTRFNEEQQICGDPEIQKWMTSTSNQLLTSFRPDMTAKRLWMSFLNNQSETSATIKDAFEYRLENIPLRDNSKSVYLSVGRTLELAGIYTTPLIEVTPALLRSFINGLKTLPSSKFNTLVRIKASITRYVKDHHLNINLDFDGIAPKPRYAIKAYEEWLTLSEIKKLWDTPLKWSKKDARDLFCLSCVSGMAMSDVLTFDPIKHIKIVNGYEFFDFTRTKTGSRCLVPVIAQAKEIIESRAWPVTMKRRSYQYHVTSTLGGILGKKLHTHMGRKTSGALFLEFGFSIEATSSFLGHKNYQLTANVYAKITSKKIENEMNRVFASGTVAFTQAVL